MSIQPLIVQRVGRHNVQNKMIINHMHIAHCAAESLSQRGFTILDIDVGGSREPKITIQYRGNCESLKPTRHGRINNELGAGFMMTATVKKCLVRWIEPAHVKELQDRQRTRPVTTKPKTVTRIKKWGITE